jgi:glycosyltransferase involved in cell wall biosynthesis
MKVLIDHPSPFLLSHGGFQIQIEQTKAALEKSGVDVEYLRWWDDSQRADIIHFFGKPNMGYVGFAHRKGIKLVLSELLTAMGSRSAGVRKVQKIATAVAEKFLPLTITSRFAWEAYRSMDAVVSLTEWEGFLMHDMFGVNAKKIHVVPNGVEQVFLNSPRRERGKWLVSTVTITERKRVVELAEAAVAAKTPLWIIGKPYFDADPYGKRFMEIYSQNKGLIRYEGAISDRVRMAEIYREARGFVLLSTMESLSLSALEAAACECPQLLSDLPWAKTVFKESVEYCPVTKNSSITASALRRFYDATSSMRIPTKPATWLDVAEQLKSVYQSIIK